VATIQFGGLITGLDTNALISGLVQAERQTSISPLETQKVRFKAQEGVFTSLIGSLASLKSSAQSLSLSTDFNKRAAASSDATVLTATADSTAAVGSNTITVDTLAKVQTIRSATFASATDTIGTGTLTLTVGSTSTPVTVNGLNNTLTGLKDSINSSGAGVTASIVNVGTSAIPDFRLVVQSKETGTANAVTISGTLAGGTDPFPGGGELVQPAADAVFSANGLTVTRSSNKVSDVIPGLTFVLLKEGDKDGLIETTDPSANVAVSVDNAAIKSAITAFVESFNAATKIVNDQFTLDPNTERQGALAGDASLRSVLSRLRRELSTAGGIGVGFKFISDIGITFQKDGSLVVDDSKLTSALATDPTGVSNLFTVVQNGIGKRVPDAVDDFISSVDGALTSRQKGIQASIERIDQKVGREEERIAALEIRLTNQFSTLEKLVSELNSQGQFLSQQLSQLSEGLRRR
jgi:flagellar hook-associated protein 2